MEPVIVVQIDVLSERWIIQQWKTVTSIALLDKPAVAPIFWQSDLKRLACKLRQILQVRSDASDDFREWVLNDRDAE